MDSRDLAAFAFLLGVELRDATTVYDVVLNARGTAAGKPQPAEPLYRLTGWLDDFELEPVSEVALAAVARSCWRSQLAAMTFHRRCAYLLVEVFGLSRPEAARELRRKLDTVRVDVVRGRNQIGELESLCSRIQRDAPCRCHNVRELAHANGRIDQRDLLDDPVDVYPSVSTLLRQLPPRPGQQRSLPL